MKNKIDKTENDDSPPFLGSWNKIYGVVLAELIFLILLFYIFTEVFN